MIRTILEHCPFCDSDGQWFSEIHFDDSIWWSCGCNNKKCSIKPVTSYYPTKEEAALAWNDREPKTSGLWGMEFIFDKEKTEAEGYALESCYKVVDEIFANYGITPVAQGVYIADASQNTFNAFGTAQRLPYSEWFLKVIDRWHVYEDGDIDDCLKTYYEIENRNAFNRKFKNIKTYSQDEVEEITGISKSTLIRAVREREDKKDRAAYDEAIAEHKLNPVTYSQKDVEQIISNREGE